MRDYLEKTLHIDVKMTEADSVYKILPLVYKGRYDIYDMETSGIIWVAICPRKDVRLSGLRKDRMEIERKTGKNCAVLLEKANYYSKEKMIEEEIPFVIKRKDIYLPFLGILFSAKAERELKPVHKISFLTQKILITGLYDRFDKATVTMIAYRLNVSKMAVSKCFDEIEFLGIDVMDSKGKSRAITMTGDRKTLWSIIRPYLRDPVIRKYELALDAGISVKAGISALSSYSMLADNQYPTYAVTKENIKESGIREMKPAGPRDEIGCVVLELGYYIDDIKKGYQDPLSVSLSLGDEMDDERVESSVEEMLEEYVW
jgi:hypothetical protein